MGQLRPQVDTCPRFRKRTPSPAPIPAQSPFGATLVGHNSTTEGGDDLGSRLPPLYDVPLFDWAGAQGDLTAESGPSFSQGNRVEM